MAEEQNADTNPEESTPLILGYHDFFPYPTYRPEQESAIQKMAESAVLGKNIVLIAQNGTGKTIMALCATLPLAMRLEQRKIIFLARTYTQNDRVIQEAKEITHSFFNENIDRKIGAISIRGRNEMCPNKTIKRLGLPPHESMSVCANLRKNKKCVFFNKLYRQQNKEKLENELKILSQAPLSAQDLFDYADQKGYCPYFLSKALIKHVEIVVCNYQWIFNPFIRENFLEFLGCALSDCIIIMDECHNLPEMANELNSFKITPYALRNGLKDLEVYNADLSMRRFFQTLQDMIKGIKKKIKEEIELDPYKFLQTILTKNNIPSVEKLKELILELDEYGDAIEAEKIDAGLFARNFISGVCEFFNEFIENLENKAYFPCISSSYSKDGKKSISIELKCSDPRLITDIVFKESLCTLSLSGTLHPYTYINLLGLNQTGKHLKIIKMKPPFPKENLKVILVNRLNTKGNNRHESMYRNMLVALKPILVGTPKNIGVFCASYEVVEGLWNAGFKRLAKICNKESFKEEPGLSASDNDILIDEFKQCGDDKEHNGGVLLGVCGGRNSEGEDFPGDYMNTVVIVGIPFQKPVPSVNARIHYYEQLFPSEGKNFGYIVPAFQRSNQACGRPIRRMNDRGLIVLMDSRFEYYKPFLSDWVRKNITKLPYHPKIIEKEVESFFSSK